MQSAEQGDLDGACTLDLRTFDPRGRCADHLTTPKPGEPC